MIRILLTTTILLATHASAATLRIRVSAPGDKAPLALVQVHPLPMWGGVERTPVRNGRVELSLEGPGSHQVRIFSPFMATAEFPVWFSSATETVDVEVKLGPAQVLPARGAALVRGEWSGFKTLEPMEAQEDGTFLYRGKSDAPVRYYIERDTALGPDRQPNPLGSRSEIMGHRFVSLAVPKDGAFEIRFDPERMKERPDPVDAKIRFPRRPDLQAAYEVEAKRVTFQAYLRWLIEVEGYRRGEPHPELKKRSDAYSEWLWSQVKGKGPRLARQVAAANVLRSTYEPEKRNELLALLPHDAPGWAAALPLEKDGGMLGFQLPEDATRAYLELVVKIATGHPDPAVRAVSLMGLASRAKETNDEATEAKYLRILRTEHSDEEFVQWWFKRRESAPYRLTAGMSFPTTDLKTTGGEGINSDWFSKAKLTVVTFSSPGCGSCRLMLHDVRRVRALYPPEQLRIVTFHASMTEPFVTQSVKADPQPWDHVALGEDEHPIEKACDVRRFPTVFLVGPDGKILEREDDLWGRLPKAVEQHLGK